MGRTKSYMTQNCKARCGLCPTTNANLGGMATRPAAAAPKAASSGAGVSDCKDAKPKYCQSLGQMRCSTGKYGGTMKMYCKSTCGHC